MPSTSEVDRAILSVVTDEWWKVARIIATVGQDEANGDVSYEFVAERIAYLVKEGRLELQGDISNWRHSEIRLTTGKL